MKNILVIFDFDGTICDTNPSWLEAYNNYLSIYNIQIDKLLWDNILQYTNDIGRIEYINEKNNLKLNEDDVYEIHKEFYKTIKNKPLVLSNGFMGLFENYPNICIATGGTLEETKEKIANLGIGKYFNEDNIYLSSTTKGCKKDLFKYIALINNFDLSNCFAVEDSVNGIREAKHAGINIIPYAYYWGENLNRYIVQTTQLGISYIAYSAESIKTRIKNLQK
ncbi:MAG: HAD hydrolase-like protein [Alphaproteobacteria bacterium]|nr:HAD hydrolase-like protein [Alphaproteobacteria bacterium]